MADDDGHETSPPSRAGGGHGLGRKIGPLPMGAWAVILGGAVGLWFFWRRSGSKAADTQSADSSAAGSGDTMPTSLVPINQGLSEDQYKSLLDAIKKLHGPDSDDDDDDKPPTTTLPGKPPGPKPKPPKPKPRPKPTKPPTHHAPRYVTTVKWHRGHVPWNSTLWGIAEHEHVKGGWQYLQKINHLHGDPKTHLKPGMRIKVSE
jgi:hypothetical protein